MASIGRKKNWREGKDLSVDKYLDNQMVSIDMQPSEDFLAMMHQQRERAKEEARNKKLQESREQIEALKPLYKFNEVKTIVYPKTKVKLVVVPYYGHKTSIEEEIWFSVVNDWPDIRPWTHTLQGFIKPININTATFEPVDYSNYLLFEVWDSGVITSLDYKGKNIGRWDFDDYVKQNTGAILIGQKYDHYVTHRGEQYREVILKHDIEGKYGRFGHEKPFVELWEQRIGMQIRKILEVNAGSSPVSLPAMKFILRGLITEHLDMGREDITEEDIEREMRYYAEREKYLLRI